MTEEAQITVSERVVKLTRGHISFISGGSQVLEPFPEATIDRLEGLVGALESIGGILAPYGTVSGKSLELFREMVAHITTVFEAFPPHILEKGTHHQADDVKMLVSRDSMSMVAFKAAISNLAARLRTTVNNMRP